ncbi:hypothetical protein ONZ45_g15141 [Pleurotus djamor]|nr:hypothetical protein ONZ45_g15141 [Pleurotus djamor]
MAPNKASTKPNSDEPIRRSTRSSSRVSTRSDAISIKGRKSRKRRHDEVTEDESEEVPVSRKPRSRSRRSTPVPQRTSRPVTPKMTKTPSKGPKSSSKAKKEKDAELAKITLQATQHLLSKQKAEDEREESDQGGNSEQGSQSLKDHLSSLAPLVKDQEEEGEKNHDKDGEGDSDNDNNIDNNEEDGEDDEDDEGSQGQDVEMDGGDDQIVVAKEDKPSKRRTKGPRGKTSARSAKKPHQEEDDDDDEDGRVSRRGPKHVKADFDEIALGIADQARALVRKKIVLEDALPLNNMTFIRTILVECMSRSEAQHYDSLPRWKRQHLLEYISYVISGIRNKVKTAASMATPNAYNLVGTSKPSVVQRRVAWLLTGGHFHYGEVNVTKQEFTYNAQLPYSHPIISDTIRNIFFEGSADKSVRGVFTAMMASKTIPLPLLALVLTAIQHSLEEFANGRKQAKEFKAHEVRMTYKYHLAAIDVLKANAGNWLPSMLAQTWNRIMLHARPSLLAALENQVDTSNEFIGVDFAALKDQAGSDPKRETPPASQPPQASALKKEAKREDLEVGLVVPADSSSEAMEVEEGNASTGISADNVSSTGQDHLPH